MTALRASPRTLLSMMAANPEIPAHKAYLAALYLARSTMTVPASRAEGLLRAQRIENTPIQHPPLFLLGHYRSGTTFLHKLLCSDPQWGYISTFDFLFPNNSRRVSKYIKPALQRTIRALDLKHMHFHNYLINLDDPLEEDMYTIGLASQHSAFWGEVFPKRAGSLFDQTIFFLEDGQKESWKKTYLYLVKKFTLRHNGKRLVLKNPPNTGRVPALLELFPDAKFVFLHRNPYQVYYSTARLWKSTLEKYYTLQDISDEERDAIIFELYEKLMTRYEQDRHRIPPQNLIEIAYRDVKTDTLRTIERIYTTLGLPNFDRAKGPIGARASQERSYSNYSYAYDDDTQDRIYERWGHFIDKWGYQRLR